MKTKILIILLILTSIISCKDDNLAVNLEQQNLRSSEDYLFAEKTVIDIMRIVESSLISTETNVNCVTYISKNNDPLNTDTLITDFGGADCLHLKQLNSGKIITIYNQYIHDSAAIINNTFDNFYLNNNRISGNIILENLGPNVNQDYIYNLEIENLVISTLDGDINLNANFKKVLISGSLTKHQYSDDIYLIFGSAEGNSVNNNNFNVNIIDSLTMNNACFEDSIRSRCVITGGNATISTDIYQDRKLDYGDDLCDCKVNVEINDDSYLILIPIN